MRQLRLNITAFSIVFGASLVGCNENAPSQQNAGQAIPAGQESAQISSAPANDLAARASSLMAAAEPFENLTENAFIADTKKLDEFIAKARISANGASSILPTAAAKNLSNYTAAIDTARTGNNRADLAIAAVEGYRTLVSSTGDHMKVPKQVSLLDYSGFRFQANLKAMPIRWNDTTSAIDFADSQWRQISDQLTDQTLHEKNVGGVGRVALLHPEQGRQGGDGRFEPRTGPCRRARTLFRPLSSRGNLLVSAKQHLVAKSRTTERKDDDMTDPQAKQMLNKVPFVTFYFWIIKVLATTVGETGADFLNAKLGFGLNGTSVAMTILLAVFLVIQMRSERYVPWQYWVVVVLLSVVGTLLTDTLTDKFGVSLDVSTAIFTVALIATFVVWYRSEHTLSIHEIHSTRREAFYWATILVTFALGTAGGDLISEKSGLGYLIATAIFAGGIALITIGFYVRLIGAVLAFWLAYILTRPLGASIGDLLTQPAAKGGLGLGTMLVSGVFLVIIVSLVIYMTVSNVDDPTDAENSQ